MTITKEVQPVHLPQNDRWQKASVSFNQDYIRMRNEKGGNGKGIILSSFPSPNLLDEPW